MINLKKHFGIKKDKKSKNQCNVCLKKLGDGTSNCPYCEIKLKSVNSL